MKKKLLAMLLAVVMVCSLMPVAAAAEEPDPHYVSVTVIGLCYKDNTFTGEYEIIPGGVPISISCTCNNPYGPTHTIPLGALYPNAYMQGEWQRIAPNAILVGYQPATHLPVQVTPGSGFAANDTRTVEITANTSQYSFRWYFVNQPAEEEVFYSVTYTDGVDGETIFDDQTYSDLAEGIATPAFSGTPTRDGYTFKGWTPDVAATVTANATYTAQWEAIPAPATYTVTYTDGVESETIFADQTYSDIAEGTATPAFSGTPTRDGYTFKGWTPDVAATVTANATYTAQWEAIPAPVTYTVTYTDGVDGEEIFADEVHENVAKDAATPAFNDGTDPVRTGFNFTGWSPALSNTVTADVTYVAQWEAISAPATYTVIYTDGVANEEIFADAVFAGLAANSKTPEFQNGVAPTRSGYLFDGWTPVVAQTVTADATYTAQWTKIPSAPTGAELKDKIGVLLDCVNTSKSHEDKNFELLDGTYTIAQVSYRENAFRSYITIKASEYIKAYNTYKSGHELAASNVDTCLIPLVYVDGTGWKVDANTDGKVFAFFEVVCKNAATSTTNSGDYDDVPKTGDQTMTMIGGFATVTALMAIAAMILAKKKRA